MVNYAMKGVEDAMETQQKLEYMVKSEHRLTLEEALRYKPDGMPISEVHPSISVGEIKKLIKNTMKYQAREYGDRSISPRQEMNIEYYYFKKWIDSLKN